MYDRHFFILLVMAILINSISLYAQDTIDFQENTQNAISKIDRGEYKNIQGILVWKDGMILGEHYWKNWTGDKSHMLQSVTKSITSLLVGIAIHEGFIESTDQKMLSFFKEYDDIQNLDSHKQALTLKDLLTMRTGMDWVEHPYHGSPLAEMNSRRNNWVKFVLDIPMREKPGQTYTYNSGGIILLGGAIRNTTDMSVQQFADQYLFQPLGIKSAEWWFADRQGIPHTGGGLNMSAKDLVKIGKLVLTCGEWGNRQILSCEYINNLFQNYQSDSISDVAGYRRGYSLLWHVFPTDPVKKSYNTSENFIAAWGAQGQWVFVFPKYNMVAVFMGNTESSYEERQAVRIIYEELIK